jgi:hypothetical protein
VPNLMFIFFKKSLNISKITSVGLANIFATFANMVLGLILARTLSKESYGLLISFMLLLDYYGCYQTLGWA